MLQLNDLNETDRSVNSKKFKKIYNSLMKSLWIKSQFQVRFNKDN